MYPRLLVKMATVPWVTLPTGYWYPSSLLSLGSNFSSLPSLHRPQNQPVLLGLLQYLLSAPSHSLSTFDCIYASLKLDHKQLLTVHATWHMAGWGKLINLSYFNNKMRVLIPLYTPSPSKQVVTSFLRQFFWKAKCSECQGVCICGKIKALSTEAVGEAFLLLSVSHAKDSEQS